MGSRSIGAPRRCGIFLALAALAALLACPARAGEGARDAEKALVAGLDGSGRKLRSVLEAYARIEARRAYGEEARRRIHAAILGKLRKLRRLDARPEMARYLRASDRGKRPVRILLLKLLARTDAGLGEEARATLFRRALGSSDEDTVRWALKALSVARWPQGVDLIIDRMREEERRGKADSAVWIEAKACLYRIFGTGMQFFTAEEFARYWREQAKRIPEKKPRYRPAQAGRRTAVFFGELVIGKAPVFVIDLSSSMRQQVTQYIVPAGRTWSASDVRRRRRKKYEWVKEELIQAVKNLTPSLRFNIIAYNSTITVWRGAGGKPGLVPATATYRKDAVRFVERIETHTGTWTQQALEAAFAIRDADTIYLLSDGVPSGRSARPPRILEIIAAKNYLRGVRIITLGFHPEGGGSFDEGFMRRLAEVHWGWYRRLNRDPRRKR